VSARGGDSRLWAGAPPGRDWGIGPTFAAAARVAIGAGEATIRALIGRGPSLNVALGSASTGRDVTEESARRRAVPAPEALVYELLDAHADTADLAAGLRWEPGWAAHLDYLRALQRTGRETLAQMMEDQP
jgi:hypothetical protein